MSTDADIIAVPVTRKKSGMNLLRVALFMIRRKSTRKNNPVKVPGQCLWKRFLGSIRSLHLQHNNNESPPPPAAITSAAPESPDHATIDHYEDVFPPPMSPDSYARSSPSSSGCDDDVHSRYGSATNLQELDKSEDSYDGDQINEYGEDLMIDIKAEEFIANFYEEMRLQQLELSDRRYDEMVARGLR